MPRYIDAEKINYRTDYNSPIYDSCGGHCCQVGYDQVASYSEIREIPTADVAPVVHAHWVYLGLGVYKCSDCLGENKDNTAFCPSCGAKMDEGQEKCGG